MTERDKHDGLPAGMTKEEIAKLKDGQKVWVKWDGGNGPHAYFVSLFGGSIYFQTEFEKQRGKRDYARSIGMNSFVGRWYPFTRVWIKDPAKPEIPAPTIHFWSSATGPTTFPNDPEDDNVTKAEVVDTPHYREDIDVCDRSGQQLVGYKVDSMERNIVVRIPSSIHSLPRAGDRGILWWEFGGSLFHFAVVLTDVTIERRNYWLDSSGYRNSAKLYFRTFGPQVSMEAYPELT